MEILNKFWANYKSIAFKIGSFQSKIILSVFYILLAPFGIFFSFFKDELKVKKMPETTWIKKNKQPETITELLKQ